MNRKELDKICTSIDSKLTQYDRAQDRDGDGEDWESEFYEFLNDLYLKIKAVANKMEE